MSASPCQTSPARSAGISAPSRPFSAIPRPMSATQVSPRSRLAGTAAISIGLPGWPAFAPTGKYDKHDFANTSLNHWAVIPNFAITYFDPKAAWQASAAFAYAVNFENPDTDYTSGSLFRLSPNGIGSSARKTRSRATPSLHRRASNSERRLGQTFRQKTRGRP